MSILCPIGCGELVDGGDVQLHYVSRCPRVPVLCPYGCQQSFRRAQLPAHEAVCEQFLKLGPQYGMMQGQVVPGEETANGFDMAWKQVKWFFGARRKEPEEDAASPSAPVSAVPARMSVNMKGGSGSAPVSPASKRKSESPHVMVRSPSAPGGDPAFDSNSPPEDPSAPVLFSFLSPLIQVYAPKFRPYMDQAQHWYEQFRDGDQKTFWLSHAILALVLIYLLSSMVIFLFKIIVFTVVMYSTGWTVYTSELFKHNEATKKYAYIATGLIGLYLFVLMH